jgi:hypothetical protein
MPQGQVNEFVVWKDGVPVVNASTDGEFDVWRDNVPDEDRDEGQNAASPSARRRVVDF